MPEPGDAVETGNARPVALELGRERRSARCKLGGCDLLGPCGRALHNVGETEAVIQEGAVVGTIELGQSKACSGVSTERRLREARPEPVGAPSEIVTLGDRVNRRIDADEDDIELIAQQVRKRLVQTVSSRQ
jgi:hypothetical protein